MVTMEEQEFHSLGNNFDAAVNYEILNNNDDKFCVYRALWRAVITQALQDAGNNFKNPEFKSIKAKAIAWLHSDSDDFMEVCLMAGYDPKYVKKRAKEAIKRNCKWRRDKGWKGFLKMGKVRKKQSINLYS